MATQDMRLMDYDDEVLRLAKEILNTAGQDYTSEQLIEIRKILDIKFKYWWCVDLQLWDMAADVFTENIQYLCNGYGGPISGKDQVARMAQSCPQKLIIPTHMGHNPIIQFTGPTTARILTQLHDHHTMKDTHALRDGWGLYVDDLIKCFDGRWRISVVRLGYRKVEGDKPIPAPKKRS